MKINVSKIYSYQTLVYKNGFKTFTKSAYLDYGTEIVNQLEPIKLSCVEKPIRVEIEAFFKIPKSWSKKKKESYNGKYAYNKNIDQDNIAKAIIDVISRHYKFNDKLICDCHVTKRWSLDEEYFNLNIEEVI